MLRTRKRDRALLVHYIQRMKEFPWSATTLALAGAFQAFFAAQDDHWSLVVVWAVVALAVGFEAISRIEFLKGRVGKIAWSAIICILIVQRLFTPTAYVRTGNDSSYITTDRLGDIWIRFAVRYNGYQEATCRTRINRLVKRDDGKTIFKDVHYLLGAEDGGDPGLSNGFVFSHGAERHFNLAHVTKDQRLSIESKTFLDVGYAPLDSGTYRATIEISGANCGLTFRDIDFEFKSGGFRYIG